MWMTRARGDTMWTWLNRITSNRTQLHHHHHLNKCVYNLRSLELHVFLLFFVFPLLTIIGCWPSPLSIFTLKFLILFFDSSLSSVWHLLKELKSFLKREAFNYRMCEMLITIEWNGPPFLKGKEKWIILAPMSLCFFFLFTLFSCLLK